MLAAARFLLSELATLAVPVRTFRLRCWQCGRGHVASVQQ